MEQKKMILLVSLAVSFVSLFWNHEEKNRHCNKSFWMYTFAYLLFSGLYISTAYIKKITGMILPAQEIISAFIVGSTLFALTAFLWYWGKQIRFKILRRFVFVLLSFGLTVEILFPAIFWGYYGVSGHLLTADIILTLFQTNEAETLAYLKSQNLVAWGITFLCLVGGIVGSLRGFWIFTKHAAKRPSWIIVALTLLISGIAVHYLPMQKNFYAAFAFTSAKQELATFEKYGEEKEKRQERLNAMPSLHRTAGGIYVLVIGESATRDHMGIYGYERDTTPWLTSQVKEGKAVPFSKGYANFTHTVPSLTYALTAKNQYNDVSLENAASLLEVAKASGYTTYWLSNQRKYSAWDTPIAEIASTADTQVWINEAVGTGDTKTQYFDDELIKYLPTCEKGTNALIVIHIMGSHGDYKDRYPSSAAIFNGKGKRVDAYDNSVLFTDEVLHKIYEVVSAYPDFQAMCYMSDHGEDPDKNVGHDATKFTWKMSHIPFIIWTSGEFQTDYSQTWRTLLEHQDAYWTNDLTYELMIDLMGIKGAPDDEKSLDIAHPLYNRTNENTFTLHKKKSLFEEK